MFRLSKSDRRDGVHLVIEGELKSEDVGTVESECLEALQVPKPVTVVIKNVTEIDEDGSALLKRLVKAKARVRAIGIYSQFFVKNIVKTAV